MVTLIFICYLASGQLFTPPDGYSVIEIRAEGYGNTLYLSRPGVYCEGGCQPPKAYVKLSRTMNVGDKIELPPGCSAEVSRTKGGE